MPLILLIFLVLPLQAASLWRLNDDHSELFFQVDYLEVGRVTGRFLKIKSLAQFSESGDLESVSFEIDPRSIDTANKQRDQHLREQDFLYTKKYPDITFKSIKITKYDRKNYSILGQLTLRGISRSQSLKITVTEGKRDSWGYQHKFVHFKSTLNREDFNIRWNKTLFDNKYLVGHSVTVWGQLQLQPYRDFTPTSKHMIPDTPSIRAREQLSRGEITQEDYNKTVGLKETGSLNRAILSPTPPVLKANAPVLTPSDVRQTTQWTVWFLLLGLFGFLGSIWGAIEGKKLCARFLQEKYLENGLWGHASDLITLTLTILFGMAFWYVGWG